MQLRHLLLLAIPLAICSLNSCSSQHNAELSSSTAGFTLNVWPESFLDHQPAGDFKLAVTEDQSGAVATVTVSDAQSLRALYIDIAYDPARWHPVEAESVSSLASGDDELLTLPHFTEPGKAY